MTYNRTQNSLFFNLNKCFKMLFFIIAAVKKKTMHMYITFNYIKILDYCYVINHILLKYFKTKVSTFMF